MDQEKPPQTPRTLGPKQLAWIREHLAPVYDGAKRVARADANAARAARLAGAEPEQEPSK